MMRYDRTSQQQHVRNGSRFWIISLIGLMIWSLAIWLSYSFSDAVIAWIDSNGPALTSIGTTVVGNEASALIGIFKLDQLAGSGVAILRGLLAPALWIIWVIGAAIILFIPLIVGRIAKLRSSNKH